KEDSRKLAALRATQTSGCLFLFRPPLLGAASKGAQYRRTQARLRFAKIAKRSLVGDAEGESDRNAAKHRNFGMAAVPTPLLGRPRCIRAPCGATRSAGPKGVRRFAPARSAGVVFFAYFLLDKQKKVSRTAVRNKRTDELVSGPKYSVSEVRVLSNRLHQSEWNSAWVCKEPLSLEVAELHEKAALGRL
ncbi:hypothetical protein, partial [Salinisphaera sp.]|uniref:hypothetical protein n=1 Tax=Salinisphaera sp. TaxID=1914330 RepID=UPI0025D00DED